MKARIPRKMTNAEMRAMDGEIREQIRRSIDEYRVYLEATYLWHRHVVDGHGIKRLTRDLENYKKFIDELKAFYEIDNTDDVTYACVKELQNIGFDVSQLGKTFEVEYSINGRKGKDAKWSRK